MEKNALGASHGVANAGKKWVERQLKTFTSGVVHLNLERFTETPGEWAKRRGPHQAHMRFAEWLFGRVAGYSSGHGGIVMEDFHNAYQFVFLRVVYSCFYLIGEQLS